MNTAVKLSAYGASLALVALGGWGVGAAVGPLTEEAGVCGGEDAAHGDVHGGTVAGIPAIVSAGVPANTIGLLCSEYVAIAGGDVVTLDASENAMLDMSGGNSPTFSLFQRNCVGLRAEIFAAWELAGGPRDSNGDPLGAILITGVTYG